MEIKTLIPCTLGYGNRPKGFVLADIEAKDILTAVGEIRTKRTTEIKSGAVQLREGVQPIEVVNGCLNDRVCHIGPSSSKPESVGPSIDKSLLPDFMPPGPSQPPVAPAPPWRQNSVKEVGLNPLLSKALTDGNLVTLGDVETYLNGGGDLKTLPGIQEANEREVLEKLAAYAK